MSCLRAHNLVKSYKQRRAVDHVSLEVNGGEIVGLLGPNGAGKTSSFYLMVGLIPSDGGQIFLDEEELTRLPMHQRARFGLGYLPQEPSIFRGLTTEDNILAVLELRQDINASQKQHLANDLLRDFHLSHLRKSKAISLSGGERRRLEIARTLALQPRFILLDEPFAGVDPISVIDIQKIIRFLAEQGIGVLITDHNVQETLRICQRAYILHQGKVLSEGTPDQILDNPDVRAVYLGESFNL